MTFIQWSKGIIEKFFRGDTYFETEFSDYLSSSRPSAHLRYNARNGKYEDISNVFKYKNNGVLISKEEYNEMEDYFINIFKDFFFTNDNLPVIVANWVNQHYIYTTDKTKYIFEEYWSSPYDMFCELRDTGKVKDDCDGYAVMIYQILRCLGTPAYRVYVRAGETKKLDGSLGDGHATCIVIPNFDPVNLHAVEGSYYPEKVNPLFNTSSMKEIGLYGNTWFICNENNSYKGNIYGD